MQLTSWEQHSFDSNLGTIWGHRGAVPFHATVLINNSPQDVIQTRIQQYSFLKNTAILTCFSCPAALLLFSEKQQPRRQALWPLCSVQLSWLNPHGSLYLAIDLLTFGPLCVCVCDNLFNYTRCFTFQPQFFIGEFKILLHFWIQHRFCCSFSFAHQTFGKDKLLKNKTQRF